MKKKLLCMILSTAMVAAVLSGCGNSEAEAPAATGTADEAEEQTEAPTAEEAETEQTEAPVADTGEPVTLTVLAGQSTTDAGIEDMIDEALAEAYPNITLEWECVDWGNDFQPKM